MECIAVDRQPHEILSGAWKLTVSIVIPAYNEQEAVGRTVALVTEALAGTGLAGFEVLVVDDGSSDGTGAEAAAAGATVLTNLHNLGYGASLKRGIQASRHDTIAIIDADLTYRADALPALIQTFNLGYDMVVAQRMGKHFDGSVSKLFLRWVLRNLVEFTAGRKIPDINSGLRVFSRSRIVQFFPHLCNTFSFTTSVTLAYMMNGLLVTYLPVTFDARAGKTKVTLFRDSLRTLQYIVEAIVYYNPIKIFIVMAAGMIGLAAVCFVTAAATGLPVLSSIGVGSLVAAPVLFSMGLLAVLLKQILAK